MSAGEIPNFDAKRYSAETNAPEVLKWRHEIDLADKLHSLKVMLENDRPADKVRHYFDYRGQSLDNVSLPLPIKQIGYKHGVLTSILVMSSHMKDYEKTNLELQLEFRDTRGNISLLTIKRPFGSEPSPGQKDILLVNTQPGSQAESMEINPMSEEQFNRCIGSLVYNNPHINVDSSAFDHYDWHGDKYADTASLFEKSADSSWGNFEYFLADADEERHPGVLSYFCADRDVTQMSLMRTTANDVIVHGTDIQYTKKSIELSLSMVRSTKIELFEHTDINGCNQTQKSDPIESDYRTAFDFIDYQISRIRQPQLEQFDDDTTQPPEN